MEQAEPLDLASWFEEAFLANIVMPNDQTVSEIVRPMIGDAYKNSRMPKALMPAPAEK